MKLINGIILIFTILLFTGCGLDDRDVNSIINTEKEYHIKEKKITIKINNFIKDEKFNKYKKYLEKEHYQDKILSIKNYMKFSKKAIDKLNLYLKNDDSDDHNNVINTLKEYNSNIHKANKALSSLYNLLDDYSKLDNNIQEYKTVKIEKHLKDLSDNILSYDKNAKSYKQKYINKKEDFKNKTDEIKKYYTDSFELNREIQKSDDLYEIRTKYNNITNNLKLSNEKTVKYINILPQLDKSYTKILSDIKSNKFVKFSFTSWDESSDYNTEKTEYITKQVTDPLYIIYAERTSVVATYSSSLFNSGNKYKINSQYIKPLNINMKNYLAHGNNSGELWVDNVFEKTYHKYTIIENEDKKDTNWILVDNNTYYSNINNIGMSILTKPYGYYEYETINKATPPGLAFVNNSQYGQWKQDSNTGTNYWMWYSMYRMFDDLTGGNRYSNSSYNNWNNNYRNKDYYGTNNNYGTFGTATSKRYQNSNFGIHNRNSFSKSKYRSSYTKSSRTSRNAGSKARGRGPSGGGK